MMNKQQLTNLWDHLRDVHGVGLRVIEAIPADSIDASPIPKMRTPKQLVVHVYAMGIHELADSVLRGRIVEIDEKPICEGIRTHADLVRFAREQWNAADKAVAQVTDAQLSGIVDTPWDFKCPGSVVFGMMRDEYLHHRGQLYAYVRVFGKEPPAMWGFEDNAPEFQAKRHAQT